MTARGFDCRGGNHRSSVQVSTNAIRAPILLLITHGPDVFEQFEAGRQEQIVPFALAPRKLERRLEQVSLHQETVVEVIILGHDGA